MLSGPTSSKKRPAKPHICSCLFSSKRLSCRYEAVVLQLASLTVRWRGDSLPTVAATRMRQESKSVLPETGGDQSPTGLTIGVLAVRDDFDAHRIRLAQLGANVLVVDQP